MTANYPTALDDDSSLFLVVDSSTAVIAAHHNNLKDAIKALEAQVGIRVSGAATSIEARLGHPSTGHTHNYAASGNGGAVYNAVFPQGASAISAFRGGLGIQVPPQPTTPGFATQGMIYFDTSLQMLVYSDGSNWLQLGATQVP